MNSLNINDLEDVNVVKSGTISQARFSSSSETSERQDSFRNEGEIYAFYFLLKVYRIRSLLKIMSLL
jgi:hypothetical protein